MKKTLLLLIVMCLVFIPTCSAQRTEKNNSFLSQSVCSTETESENESSLTQSQNSSAENNVSDTSTSQNSSSAPETESDNQSTSSRNHTSSAENSASKEAASQKGSSSAGTTSKNQSTSSQKESSTIKPTSSQTQSSGIVQNIADLDTIGIGAYHFNPAFAHNYVTEEATDWQLKNSPKFDTLRYEEMEDVLKAGYFNTIIMNSKNFNDVKLWQLCEKYEVTVWYHPKTHFHSEETSIDNYIKSIDSNLKTVKSNKKWWSLFAGFTFEEPFWMGKQSNNEFLAETEALYKKYGKRLMPMFAVYEFTSYENGNTNIDMDDKQILKINPKSTKYLTDIGFDSYDVDVRQGAPNANRYSYWQSILPNKPKIVDGDSYYTEYISYLLSLVDHDVNVWFHPSASTRNIWGGINGLKVADEDFCLSHLEYFREKLYQQKYKGGLILYNYKQFKEGVQTLERLLVINDQSGNPKMFPEIEKWPRYSQRLKEITQEFKGTTDNKITRLK